VSLRSALDAFDLLDRPGASGADIVAYWRDCGTAEVSKTTVAGPGGHTDFVRALIPGSRGRTAGGSAPTLGVVGQLGGIGARPEQIGFVSDGDGALTAVATAAKLARMHRDGDILPGDVIVATHICPDAPVRPHDPVPFMSSPVDIPTSNTHQLDPAMDAVLAVDTTKGNRICNHAGFAITPTVCQGWILRVSDDLLDIASWVSGRPPAVLPITMQDITPYGNGIYHLNSILQPSTGTAAPVTGVAITTESAVPGSATGATDLNVVASAVRFCVETAKGFGRGAVRFHDQGELAELIRLYGTMDHLQKR
jgi:Protein of unknown function (DUF1177)